LNVTKRWLGLWGVLLLGGAGCQTTKGSETKAGEGDARPAAASAALQKTLDGWPRCEAGADAGKLSVAATVCTKKYCGAECCNACGWAATFEGKSGARVPVDAERARALLQLTAGALECEVAAWGRVLEGVSLAIDGTPCVVR
jgi:hypothetical protein